MDAVSGEPRMPATCFTKASSTKTKSTAIFGTQIEEIFAQTSEETDRLQKQHTLSSFECSRQGEGDHTSNSANHVELRQHHGDQKTSNKNPMQHIATPVHPSHLSIQLEKHKAGCTNRKNFIRIPP